MLGTAFKVVDIKRETPETPCLESRAHPKLNLRAISEFRAPMCRGRVFWAKHGVRECVTNEQIRRPEFHGNCESQFLKGSIWLRNSRYPRSVVATNNRGAGFLFPHMVKLGAIGDIGGYGLGRPLLYRYGALFYPHGILERQGERLTIIGRK